MMLICHPSYFQYLSLVSFHMALTADSNAIVKEFLKANIRCRDPITFLPVQISHFGVQTTGCSPLGLTTFALT